MNNDNLNTLKNTLDVNDYIDSVGYKNKRHKVSLFFKIKELEELKDKKILFIDFEFSKEYNIFEIGCFVKQNDEIIDIWFEKFTLPIWDYYFNFDTKRMIKVNNNFNNGRTRMNKDIENKIINLFESSDYIVTHNYTAELTCVHKLLYDKRKYKAENLDYFNNDKIICTMNSFNPKYIKEKYNISKFSNSIISEFWNWDVTYEDNYFFIHNKDTGYKEKIKSSFKFNGEKDFYLHNALYDSIITYTNFLSLTHLINKG